MPMMPNVVGMGYHDALVSMVSAGVRVLPLGYFQADPVTIAWVTPTSAKPMVLMSYWHLSMVTIMWFSVPIINPGQVTDQSPAAGSIVASNSAVSLTALSFPMSVSNFGGIGS
jgi:hypothetical protein